MPRKSLPLVLASFLALTGCATMGGRAGIPDPGLSLPARSVAAAPTRCNPAGAGQVGIASYYAHSLHGRRTASGAIYDENAMTAAHRSLPLGTTVLVTNLENHRSLELLVNDRGPYHGGRILDVSSGAARRLGFSERGVARVRIQVLDA